MRGSGGGVGGAAKSAALIWTACVVVAALMWGGIFERVRHEEAEALRAIERNNANLVLAFRERTASAIKSIEQLLRFMTREQASHHPRDLYELTRAWQIDYKLMSSVVLLDVQGNVASQGEQVAPLNLAHTDFFDYHRRSDDGELRIGRPMVSALNGHTAIPFTRRISRPDGGFGGVAVANIDPVFFTDFASQMDLGRDGLTLLVALDGTVLARRAGSTTRSGGNVRESTLLKMHAQANSGNFLSLGEAEGVRRYTNYHSLPEHGLIVAVGVSRAEALAPFFQRRGDYYSAGGVFTLLVATLAASLTLVARRRVAARLEARRQEARFRATFDQGAVGIVHVALDGGFLKANAKFCAMLGYAEAELAQRTFADVTFPEDIEIGRAAHRAGVELAEASRFEKRYVRKDGSLFWASVALSPVRDPDGRSEYFVAVVQDISEQKEAQARVLHQAQHDPLTDLPNRVLFHDLLAQALSQARRQGWAAGVMVVDLDHFKQVNDTLGHAAGDALLREVAARLARSVRASDTAARTGGDEFAVVLAELARIEDAAAVAEKILAAMAVPMRLEGNAYTVTVSIGVALFPRDGNDAETLVRGADQAMFQAKQAGRNSFRIHAAGETPGVRS